MIIDGWGLGMRLKLRDEMVVTFGLNMQRSKKIIK